MKINENGFWENPTSVGHAHDQKLAGAIVKLFDKYQFNSVLDLGCGMGDYSRLLQGYQFEVHAYDGNPNTPQLTSGLGQVADLSKVFDCGEHIDAVLSLEVGEHIPAEFEQTFLDNVVVNKPEMIVLSWAIPGQAGDGHVNCQPNKYIEEQMKVRGYQLNKALTYMLRHHSSLWWFRNTIMVFE
jgi:cyclopropane fatty-acyl-phospholipid synthase-like methyltransferase